MSERYSVQSIGDGEAFVYDSQTEAPVKTEDGTRTYVAPLADVQWTADHMNRMNNRHVGDVEKTVPATDRPLPEQTPADQDRLEYERGNRPEVTPAADVLNRLESCASLEDRLNTPMRATKTEPVVRAVTKVDYPRMAGKALGSIGVLSGRLASIGRWLDALEDGSVSPEYAMRQLRRAQTEAYQYAEDIYNELSSRR